MLITKELSILLYALMNSCMPQHCIISETRSNESDVKKNIKLDCGSLHINVFSMCMV